MTYLNWSIPFRWNIKTHLSPLCRNPFFSVRSPILRSGGILKHLPARPKLVEIVHWTDQTPLGPTGLVAPAHEPVENLVLLNLPEGRLHSDSPDLVSFVPLPGSKIGGYSFRPRAGPVFRGPALCLLDRFEKSPEFPVLLRRSQNIDLLSLLWMKVLPTAVPRICQNGLESLHPHPRATRFCRVSSIMGCS